MVFGLLYETSFGLLIKGGSFGHGMIFRADCPGEYGLLTVVFVLQLFFQFVESSHLFVLGHEVHPCLGQTR